LVFFTVFGTIEGVYMTAVLNKVPQGGWVPFAIAAVFLVIMSSWNYGHQRKIHYEMNNKMSVHSLQDLISNSEVQRVKGICFFYSDLVHGVPPIIPHYIRNVQTLHQILIFSTIRYLPIRTVLPEERFLVGRVGIKGAYRCVARYGYMDVINLKGNEFKDQVLQQLQAYLQSEDQNNLSFVQRSSVRLVNESGRVNHNGVPNQPQLNLEDIRDLNLAAQHESVHVLGRTMLECGPSTGYLDRIVVNKIYRFLKMICRPAVQALQIPSANFLEVGIYYEL
jgi:KUP system potassium uptake protein